MLIALYGHNSPIGLDVAGTRIAVLFALLFVTLPFVTRAVQPVLLTLETDVEDAAACLGAGPADDVPADHVAGDPAGDDHRRLAGVRPRPR